MTAAVLGLPRASIVMSPRIPPLSRVRTPILIPVATAPGFDRSDAAIGGGAGAGLILLVFGASVLLRQHRRELGPA